MAELYAQQLSSQNEEGKQSLQVVTKLQQERDELAGQVQQVIHDQKSENEQMGTSETHEIIMIDVEASMVYCLSFGPYKPVMGVLGMRRENKNIMLFTSRFDTNQAV